MTDLYTQIAQQTAADLRAEGCTRSVAVTPANREKQPLWARQEVAGRLYLKRDIINRLPGEDHLEYEQALALIINRADEALGLIVARGPSPAATVYRIMSYHTQLDDLAEDWLGIMADMGVRPVFDTSAVRAKILEALGMLPG